MDLIVGAVVVSAAALIVTVFVALQTLLQIARLRRQSKRALDSTQHLNDALVNLREMIEPNQDPRKTAAHYYLDDWKIVAAKMSRTGSERHELDEVAPFDASWDSAQALRALGQTVASRAISPEESQYLRKVKRDAQDLTADPAECKTWATRAEPLYT